MAPKGAKDGLASEAANMEMKLFELRKAMEKERLKREALLAGAGSQQSIWRNGGSGLLRSNYRAKSTSQGTDTLPSQHQQGAESSDSRTMSLDASPARDKPASSAGNHVLGVSGSRLASAQSRSRHADILKLQDEDPAGMAVGTDEGANLLDGNFNEGESHTSFLEALEEWRRGNRRGDEQALPIVSGTTAAASGAEIDVQTEKARPRSAAPKPVSLFDKLVINTVSRQAGALAEGAPAALLPSQMQSSVATHRPSSQGQSQASPAGDEQREAGQQEHIRMSSHEQGRGADSAVEADNEGPSACTSCQHHELLAVLEKLEELELLAEQRARAQADEDVVIMSVTTDYGALTKHSRLPDNVLVPKD